MLFDAPAVLPALLTPCDDAGGIDRGALREHVEFVIDGGVDGIMPCGTTGETALLGDDEVLEVVAGVGVLVSDPFEPLAFELGELDGVGGVRDVEVKHGPDERQAAGIRASSPAIDVDRRDRAAART